MPQLEEDFSPSSGETTSPSALPQNKFGRTNASSSSPSDLFTHQNKTSPPASQGSNSRSCATCRKRKVKCDKRHPCSNCNKAATECVFPGPGRAPRQSRRLPDTELLARLRRLEGVVQGLGKGIDEEGETTIRPKSPNNALNGGSNGETPEQSRHARKMLRMQKFCSLERYEPNKDDPKTNSMIKEFGRLVVEEGRSRYVSNKFWTSLSEEVAEMRDILDDPTDDEEQDYPLPGSGLSASAHHQGFIFSFSSTILSLRNFHPQPTQVSKFWAIYESNVDPIMKVLHIPSTGRMICDAARDLDHISKPMEALLFTIYFAAVTSLSVDDCMALLGQEKQAALRKYRFATEQAFARADFLSTQEILVLQSLLVFLTCVRRQDETRYVWTLTGLLIRLAQALGVHRDGQQFGLSPFETEMRRRLWWQICTLDVRTSEDHGCDPSIMEHSFDTKFPLNINDADISPDMTETPEEHEGATEMTFDLMRYSVTTSVRRISYAPVGGPCLVKSAGLSLEDKERIIEDLNQYLEKKYIRYCDTTVPLHWVAATVARLVMAKMWLVVHHPLARPDAGVGLPQENRDRLFRTSLEVIEFSRLLETEKATMKWGWLFRTYVQWQALAYVLSQLCVRVTGPVVDKAWIVIEGIFDHYGGLMSGNQKGMLWKPLKKLMTKAKAERKKALDRLALFPLDGSIGPASGDCLEPGLGMNDGPNYLNNFSSEVPVTDNSFPLLTSPTSSGTASIDNIGQQQNELNSVKEWNVDPAALMQDPLMPDESMDWAGWEDVVKDFQMEEGQGSALGGMMTWW